MKKTISALMIAGALSSGIAYAGDFSFRVYLKEKLSTWSDLSTQYSPWMNDGELHSCPSWSPEPESMPYGESFQQSRECSQTQVRTATKRQQDSFSGLTRVVSESNEFRDILVEETQQAIGGLRNWVDHSSTFTEWVNTDAQYGHTEWSPSAKDQTTDFVVTRDYSQDQERYRQDREIDSNTGDVRDTGEPVKETQTIVESESNTVTVSYTAWQDSGVETGCAEWSPIFEQQVENFSQSTFCDSEQNRDRQYSMDGNIIASESETRDHTIDKTRDVVVALGGWADSGEQYDCEDWDKDASAFYIEETVDRSKTCKQDQETEVSYSVEGVEVYSDVASRTNNVLVEESVSGLKHHTLELRSCGQHHENPGCASAEWGVYVDGQKYQANRSYTMVVLNPVNKSVVSARTYDIYGYQASGRIGPDEFNADIDAVPDGYIIAIAAYDEPSNNAELISSKLQNYLGATMHTSLYGGFRTSYYIAGYKNGAKITENWAPRYANGIRSGVIKLN